MFDPLAERECVGRPCSVRKFEGHGHIEPQYAAAPQGTLFDFHTRR